jgi:hypothetical protein
MPKSVTYQFTQRFNVPAREAFHWSTDYRPDDWVLMKEKGQRRIQRITKDTIILTEVVSIGGKKIKKTKLVKLHPPELSWYNVQIAGPNRHSVFLYKIVSEGKRRSRLIFTGLLVVYGNARLSQQRLRQIANKERQYDANAWKHLARAMTADYKRGRNRAG